MYKLTSILVVFVLSCQFSFAGIPGAVYQSSAGTNTVGTLPSNCGGTGQTVAYGINAPLAESSNFNAVAGNNYLVTCSSSNIVCTLPTAVGATGLTIGVTAIGIVGGSVQFATTSSQLINGNIASQCPYLTSNGASFTFISDGSNWFINSTSLINLTNIPANSVFTSNSTGTGFTAQKPLGLSSGGIGLTTTPTDGQLLIGKTSTNAYVLSTLTAGSSKISITNGSGSITLDVNQGNLSLSSLGGSLNLGSQVSGTLGTTNGGTGSSSTQSPLYQFGGPASPTAAAAAPSFQMYDSASIFGGASNIRSLPTSGTITGEYWHNGNWTQTGAITSNRARIHINGTMTINNTWTVNTEMSGGLGGVSVGSSAGYSGTGGSGSGLGIGSTTPGGFGTGIGGAGAGHGGVGGNGGCGLSGLNCLGGGSYPLESLLTGTGGNGGASFNAAVGGAGGAGGGSLYIETTGNISCTASCVMTAAGGAGTAVSGTSAGGGGGGSGGGIQIRTQGTFTLSSGGSITAPGGSGGNSSGTNGCSGGGGAGGIIDISSSTTTNNGTISASGGSAGTGTNVGTSGSTGIVNLNSFIQNVRSAN